MNLKQKLTSRKFWISVAGFIAGIGTTLQGVSSGNDTVIIAGVVCTAVSTAIYTICEAMVDAADRNVIDVNDNEIEIEED